MRLKTIFKIGLKSLFSHILRLTVVLVLAAVALGLLGTAVTASLFDENRARSESVYTFEDRYIVTGTDGTLSQEDIAAFAAAGRNYSLCTANSNNIVSQITSFLDPSGRNYGTTGALYEAPWYVVSAGAAAIEDAGISVIGRLPSARNEVALSMCQFRLFLENGYYDNIASPVEYDEENGYAPIYDAKYLYSVTDPESFAEAGYRIYMRDCASEDLAAVMETTIVGIVDYGACPYEHIAGQPVATHGIGYYDAIFVSEDYFSEMTRGVPQYAITEKRPSFASDEAFIGMITASGTLTFESEVLCGFEQSAGRLNVMKNVFGYIGIGLTLFCAIIIFQFISFLLESKKGEIGILRALGAGKKVIVLIFLVESLLLAFLQAALGSVLTAVMIPVVNIAVRGNLAADLVFMQFSVFPFLALFGVSIAVSLISSLIPILKTASKQPVEAIRRNEI